jgi:hypothetical protein
VQLLCLSVANSGRPISAGVQIALARCSAAWIAGGLVHSHILSRGLKAAHLWRSKFQGGVCSSHDTLEMVTDRTSTAAGS